MDYTQTNFYKDGGELSLTVRSNSLWRSVIANRADKFIKRNDIEHFTIQHPNGEMVRVYRADTKSGYRVKTVRRSSEVAAKSKVHADQPTFRHHESANTNMSTSQQAEPLASRLPLQADCPETPAYLLAYARVLMRQQPILKRTYTAMKQHMNWMENNALYADKATFVGRFNSFCRMALSK